MKKAIEIVKVILDKESRGWYLTYKDRLIAELKGKPKQSLYGNIKYKPSALI